MKKYAFYDVVSNKFLHNLDPLTSDLKEVDENGC